MLAEPTLLAGCVTLKFALDDISVFVWLVILPVPNQVKSE
jgi:hypothetical protein